MGDSSKGLVLVVESDEATREGLRASLEGAGYAVTALPDERIAVAYLKRARVDVVVLDSTTSSLAKTLRTDPALRKVRAVDRSSLADRGDSEQLLAAIARLLVSERRQSPRYPARFDVVCTASSSALGMTTRDVSTGGLSLDTTVAPSVGDRMSLTIDLAIHGVTAMEVEVKNVAPTPCGWRIGAQFRDFQYNSIGFDAELELLARSTTPLS